MSNPNSNPNGDGVDILTRYVEEMEDGRLEERWSEETLAARQAVMNLPEGHGGPTGKPDPALVGKSTDELKQLLADQLKASHPEAYRNHSPSFEDAQREQRLREQGKL